MHQIDDKLLEDLGLASLPQNEKEQMKAQIYETLEMRVGMKLASRMSEDQLTEFEGFMSGDVTKSTEFLSKLNQNWREDQALQASIEAARSASDKAGVAFNENALITEFAALKWLETNFPDYKKVVSDELEKLKNEIKEAAPQILEASK